MMNIYRSSTMPVDSYRSAYEAWFNNLPVPLMSAVYDYTESGYSSLNRSLRNGTADNSMMEKASELDSALSLHDASSTPELLFRGSRKPSELANYVVGESVVFPSFISTSSDPHQVFKFTDEQQPIVLEFSAKKAFAVSDIHNEFEFLIPRDSVFLVENVMTGVSWNAEYEGTDYSRGLKNVTVIQLKEI
jgi:ADP-ribosyltransferase exoenzyme